MGAVMRRRGESVFCAGAGGSRRKRPQRRPCKNRRTRAAFERTARRAAARCSKRQPSFVFIFSAIFCLLQRREDRLARGRSAGRSASRGAAAARWCAPADGRTYPTENQYAPTRGFAAGRGIDKSIPTSGHPLRASARRRRHERRRPGARK